MSKIETNFDIFLPLGLFFLCLSEMDPMNPRCQVLDIKQYAMEHKGNKGTIPFKFIEFLSKINICLLRHHIFCIVPPRFCIVSPSA